MELFQGGILSKVKLMTQPGQTLSVKMPTAVVAVRGTEFPKWPLKTAFLMRAFLTRGHVDVSGPWGREHVQFWAEIRKRKCLYPPFPKRLIRLRIFVNTKPN